jgi:2-dehydro-3-deoxyphosphogluconate aldolase/(4S)-4-hydroxy-2-oxoglutarate aldolase
MAIGERVAALPRPAIPPALEQTRVIGILRHTAPDLAVRTAEALVAGGVTALEVTMNSAGALGMLEAIQAALGDRVVLGMGTVLDMHSAEAALGSGARFIVCPHTDVDLVRGVSARGVPIVPGAFTATEIVSAWSAGASLVKVFPMGSVGPAYLKDMRGPLGHVPFVPTGGVTLENAGAFIEAGAWGLGLGSALASPALIDAGDFGELTRRAAAFIAIAQRARR